MKGPILVSILVAAVLAGAAAAQPPHVPSTPVRPVVDDYFGTKVIDSYRWMEDSNALRTEYETDGDANALEYGSAKNEAGFKALLAVEAVQHVKGGTIYPATLLTTGINDPRVAPWQPGKMAARLQAASAGARPILLRVDYDAGHGFGSTRTQRDELLADQLAFMYWQMGDPEFQPRAH
jgi:protease II